MNEVYGNFTLQLNQSYRVLNFAKQWVAVTDAYSEPYQTSKMDSLTKKSLLLLAIDYSCKTFHLRCLTGCLWIT